MDQDPPRIVSLDERPFPVITTKFPQSLRAFHNHKRKENDACDKSLAILPTVAQLGKLNGLAIDVPWPADRKCSSGCAGCVHPVTKKSKGPVAPRQLGNMWCPIHAHGTFEPTRDIVSRNLGAMEGRRPAFAFPEVEGTPKELQMLIKQLIYVENWDFHCLFVRHMFLEVRK